MKKCPHCNSSRYTEFNGISHCDKCGFVNDKYDLKRKKTRENSQTPS